MWTTGLDRICEFATLKMSNTETIVTPKIRGLTAIGFSFCFKIYYSECVEFQGATSWRGFRV